MKKLLVVAALAGTMFAVPTVSVQAEPLPAKCLILPLLQADCRAAISDALGSAKAKTSAAVTASAGTNTDWMGAPHPWLWWTKCERTGGTKPFLTCD